MSLNDGALLAGAILILISIPWILISLYEWYCDKKLKKNGRRVTGVITECVTYPHDDTVNTGQYRFIADFTDHNGITAYSKSRFASRSPQLYMNKNAVIIYDEKDSNHSRFETDISLAREVLEKIFLLILGIGLLLYGI